MTSTTTTLALPATGTYALDTSHSHVGFKVRHLVVAKVRGRFADFDGTITVAEDALDSSVTVEVRTASVDTRDETRDGHLRSADFFDVERFPVMAFRSTGVREEGEGRFAVVGDLTIGDTTRPVTLDVRFDGSAVDPWGGERIAFTAETRINREDFGLTYNQALETGGVLVGKEIDIEIDVEAVRQTD
jgi:polyisoprenoid-binding protein YceI